jgi:Icc protein
MSQATPLFVAQITDLHLFADAQQELLGLQTFHSFQAILTRVQQLQPRLDLLLLTGDLSQDETVQSYECVKQCIAPLGIPTYWIPGNHDDVPIMQRVFTQPPFSSDKVFYRGGWNFILLNSGVPGYVHGYLSATTLEWLDQQLYQQDNHPTLVALHHPPFIVGSDWLDGSTLQNPEELFAVLDRHPQVKLVLCGHVHQEFQRERRGVFYLTTPSTCIQFKPRSHQFALDTAQPGFRLLKIYADGRWETKVERVEIAYQPNFASTGY